MDTSQGLVVPNIKNAQNKSIFEIAKELNTLQDIALAGRLELEHLQGGTFSLSNIGSVSIVVLPFYRPFQQLSMIYYSSRRSQ
jgi:2-oxoisovalerate dehydrogenase E2 component (dihydrolipoyl transacylase)